MDTSIARQLIDLNTRFYRANAASFSATREAPWDGWRRIAVHAAACVDALAPGKPLKVLDLACGNMRLERFLADELPGARFEFHAVDNCGELAAGLSLPAGVVYHNVDILGALLDAASDDSRASAPRAPGMLERVETNPSPTIPEWVGMNPSPTIPLCALSCCFGFMHHVPGFELRVAVLRELVRRTAPGGIIAVSFWQFMHDERLASKAQEAERAAREHGLLEPAVLDALEPGDHLLGWQDGTSLRYCHHFEEREIDQFIEALPAGTVRPFESYSADGRAGNLNRYVLLRRTAGSATAGSAAAGDVSTAGNGADR